MTAWTAQSLAAITEAGDFHIAPDRADGTPRAPTEIWSVTVDNALYVRAYRGTRSVWYRAAVDQRTGTIRAAGSEYDVTFVPTDPTDIALQNRIDAAYHDKYDPSPYVEPMLTAEAHATTLQVVPRA